MANDYQLKGIELIEYDPESGLRIKGHQAWSFFDADRMLEKIRDNAQNNLPVVFFKLKYAHRGKPHTYRGVYRFEQKHYSLSLQNHIEVFLAQYEEAPEELKITPDAYASLCKHMNELFEQCATEQIFKANENKSIV